MKALIVFALITGCTTAMAEEVPDTTGTLASAQATPAVEQYRYGMNLDIAHIVTVDAIPAVCEVVPTRMTYDDSDGKRHILEYRVMGNGCSN